jgi:hypothetical protein
MAACLLIELDLCHWKSSWKKALTALPAELFGIYSHFLTRAQDSVEAVFIQAIFQWLVFSARQVSSDELVDAIAFDLSDPDFDFSDPDKSVYDSDRRQGNYGIFKLLEGLIVVKESPLAKSSIAFAHSSVKDYLLSPQFQEKFGRSICLTEAVSHRFITQTCVRYLLLFADAKHLMTKDTLPDYQFPCMQQNIGTITCSFVMTWTRTCYFPGQCISWRMEAVNMLLFTNCVPSLGMRPVFGMHP